MENKEYPDIEFVETDVETIENSLIALYELMYEEMTGKKKKVYPASPERLFIAWAAAVIVQQRVLINETAKKNVPRYAKGEYLDSLAELFKDTPRLPASPAIAVFRCHISEAQPQSVIVKAGTRINFDGNIIFSTVKDLEIKAGDTYGDVNAQCLTPGLAGNDLAVGQVKEIIDAYDYFLKIENITRTAGGADEEDDASYYERMRESMESFSTAGPINGYIYHVKTVTPAIADVTATSPEPGVVDIRILLQNGDLPTDAVINEIQEALNTSDIRPLTDMVTVSKPQESPFDIDVTYYIPRYSQAGSNIIDAAAKEAVTQYIKWQTGKMGRDINPSRLNSMLMAAGVKRVEIRKPLFAVVPETHVARLGSQQVLNGGIEDE
ncbi:baseplate J/gp47 family protein [[Clostridium] symbiosum]|uniref:Baseplate J family protein n=1 Tax=Enterocloster clostridioformis TaxID=1531 RepID=A0A2X2UEX9_9FIRM|nr:MULTISPECIES: baseplate J/gp47 family protein [Lachnospiraceae]MCA5576561.1 baseplate J/gp47 family protein [Enterocloster clostridioformis]MDB2017061.1 baseplate J/gp47 family protein [[Clostridium] symbiosum]CUO38373.1 baseplate J family protein [[Clostridium] symbiosum]SQB14858.1 baseplate J family protein [Enterocloster clostridioformis]